MANVRGYIDLLATRKQDSVRRPPDGNRQPYPPRKSRESVSAFAEKRMTAFRLGGEAC